jgi:NADPH-dependent curcumin reductase CurA
MPKMQRQIVFAPRPAAPLDQLFELRDAPIGRPAPGQVLVRNLVLSCDPAQVAWLMRDSRFAPKVKPGEVMRAWGAGEVIESKHPEFAAGDRVWGTLGWQEYSLSDETGVLPLQRIAPDMELSAPLGAAGINGLTAYIGLVDICQLRAGERVVVSTAAGATGSSAAQIARILGAQVIGIAGGLDKCRFVREQLGAADCIDYKAGHVAALCPDDVDVYFDNVGGSTLDALLGRMARGGRIALCGATAQYAGEAASGASLSQILARTLRVQGLLLYQHRARFAAISEQLFGWVRSGQLQLIEDRVHGLERAPAAMLRLFEGKNRGKQLVVLDAGAVG